MGSLYPIIHQLADFTPMRNTIFIVKEGERPIQYSLHTYDPDVLSIKGEQLKEPGNFETAYHATVSQTLIDWYRPFYLELSERLIRLEETMS